MAETTIQDATFGTLTWETAMSWWIGEFEYNPEQQVWAHIFARDETDVAAIDQARALLAEIRRNETVLQQFAFENLKDSYFEAHSDNISAAAFCRKLAVDSLTFQQADGYEIAFEDGGMFGGHIIVVSVDETGTAFDAEIAG